MESGRSGEGCRAARRASVPVRSQLGIRRRLTRSVRRWGTPHARQPDRPPRECRVRRPRPRTLHRRRDVRAGRARQRPAHPRAGRDRQERAAARDPPPRRARVGTVRARRARPAAGPGRRRAGAGRRVDGGAAAGPDRHLRAHERARRLPALDAAPFAARRTRWWSSPAATRPSPAGSRAAGRRSRSSCRSPRSPSTRRARCCAPGPARRPRARRRSRAGRADCRWRCGSARPPRARIRRGRPAPTRRRCVRTCSACRTRRSPVRSATCSRSRASRASSRPR